MLNKKILSPGDGLEDAMDVRMRVFVEEQGFSSELEADETDPLATHVVLYGEDGPVATGRVFAEADKPYEYHIGRVAVLEPYRKNGIGFELMSALELEAERMGAGYITLSSQCGARAFYEKCGYTAQGDVYYEEHCPHVSMSKRLKTTDAAPLAVDKTDCMGYNGCAKGN